MYEILAQYYDQLHASLTADVPFVRELAEEQGGPVLEVGSGTGRLLIPLAEAGFHVTGIDSSPQMMSIARRHLLLKPDSIRDSIHLVEQDIRSLTPDQFNHKFALALLSYNTLMHFPESDIKPLLQTLARGMRDNAVLFLDLENPFAIASAAFTGSPVLETSFTDSHTDKKIEQWSLGKGDTESQMLDVSWLFRDPAREEILEEVHFRYYYYYPHQIDLFLQSAGFKLEQLLGSYAGDPFAEGSERLLMLARLAN